MGPQVRVDGELEEEGKPAVPGCLTGDMNAVEVVCIKGFKLEMLVRRIASSRVVSFREKKGIEVAAFRMDPWASLAAQAPTTREFVLASLIVLARAFATLQCQLRRGGG